MSVADNNLQMIEADAQVQDSIIDEQIAFYKANGFLVARQVLVGEELEVVRQAMLELYDKGVAGVENDPDFMYAKGVKSGRQVLRRIEYVQDKAEPMKALLAHPFILRSVEKLQGRNFIPTWDSMVVKVPDEGVEVPWHLDAAVPESLEEPRPIFNVDFYLDRADMKSCLWVIPASNQWDEAQVAERCGRPGFDFSDAIPVPIEAGDVIFHDITLVHGSPAGNGNAMRRTVYYEFRPAEIESAVGPHIPEYIPLKQAVLLESMRKRAETSYGQREDPFVYAPTGKFALEGEPTPPPTFRYAHKDYWRK